MKIRNLITNEIGDLTDQTDKQYRVEHDGLIKYWDKRNSAPYDIAQHVREVTAGNNTTTDPVVLSVMSDLNKRSIIGIGKYGTDLSRTDLNLRAWLQHAYEETLDKANYLKRCIMEIDKTGGK